MTIADSENHLTAGTQAGGLAVTATPECIGVAVLSGTTPIELQSLAISSVGATIRGGFPVGATPEIYATLEIKKVR